VTKLKNPPKRLNLIREKLKLRNRTQAWLAGALDLEIKTINNYVNNRRQPTLGQLFEIARALKMNVKDLINS
jgi:transcriptional regulator with XRE-family HTH domain